MKCSENTNTAVHVTDHTSKLVSQMIFGAGRNYYGAVQLHARNTITIPVHWVIIFQRQCSELQNIPTLQLMSQCIYKSTLISQMILSADAITMHWDLSNPMNIKINILHLRSQYCGTDPKSSHRQYEGHNEFSRAKHNWSDWRAMSNVQRLKSKMQRGAMVHP